LDEKEKQRLWSLLSTFNREAFALVIILFTYTILHKKAYKKAINPIVLLLLSGLFGLIIF